ncbi:MAG: ABC transporter ATP-binding protein [Gammaproteobacteria bacterium]|jgi:ATP-binding cassette subfamily B protein|nr:ABC transporter ATP-binding protein [Gammaproteobacteria bacterium]MBT5442343.1 ABC transporter ATP-binding protein [Gammaproteobacteria bacterium]MBT5792270.1 ABC transporter ATP-binding protein [Gammaproteobacteria bacterium]MBT6948697.1 ABC transporter ATP-binding protein [Gammaproteobacteria bacterium]MBT7174130.1 ABC transporter ATP-binding protein [Gammaproteobacteria bacterium]
MTDKVTSNSRDHSLFDAELSGAVLNMHLLGRLVRWLRPYRLKLVLSTVLVLIASYAAVVMEVLISRVLVDYIIVGKADSPMPDMGMIALTIWVERQTGLSSLNSAGLLFFIVMVLFALAGHWHRLTLTSAIVKGLRDLRQDLFAHMETRPSSFYDKVPVGRVMTRVTNDIEALFEMLRGVGSLIGEFVPFFVALAVMFSTSVKLTLLLLALVPVVGVATYFFRRSSREVFRRVRNSVSSLNQNLQENLSGIQVVQLSGREDKNLGVYTALNKENRRQEYRSINLATFYGAFNDSLTAIGLGLIIWFGAGEVVQDEMTLGGVILFTRFMGMLFTPVVTLGEQLNVLFRAMASGERIFQALDWDEQIHEPVSPVTLPPRIRGKIEFRRVSFGYESGNPILKDVSFVVKPGEKLAIVGPTGSGKSTLIKLLGRFYDFPDGMLFLDDVDINHLHSRDVRSRVGVVLQDFHIFSGTILDNILLGDPTITRDMAIAAAKTVNAHGFISSQRDGYDTLLQERGTNLSQGERQLLAFARVLAADPEVLVLDEATASIDTETELLIQDGLEKLMADRTAILIAHRLQTIQQADKILVLQSGEVLEYGSQTELLELKGLYHTLHELQFQDLKTVSG